MDGLNLISDNLIQTVLIIGIVLLIVEVAVLGFSTFFLFFAGLAAITTALLMWLGLFPEVFLYSLVSIAVFTLLYASLLWKPLSNMQNKVDTTRAKNDLVGHTFVLSHDVVAALPYAQKPQYQFSGIDWRLHSQVDLLKGTLVEVTQADVGALWIKAK